MVIIFMFFLLIYTSLNMLQFGLEQGLMLKEIYESIYAKKEAFMKSYIELNNSKRTQCSKKICYHEKSKVIMYEHYYRLEKVFGNDVFSYAQIQIA